jgi:hypothetical protein
MIVANELKLANRYEKILKFHMDSGLPNDVIRKSFKVKIL